MTSSRDFVCLNKHAQIECRRTCILTICKGTICHFDLIHLILSRKQLFSTKQQSAISSPLVSRGLPRSKLTKVQSSVHNKMIANFGASFWQSEALWPAGWYFSPCCCSQFIGFIRFFSGYTFLKCYTEGKTVELRANLEKLAKLLWRNTKTSQWTTDRQRVKERMNKTF